MNKIIIIVILFSGVIHILPAQLSLSVGMGADALSQGDFSDPVKCYELGIHYKNKNNQFSFNFNLLTDIPIYGTPLTGDGFSAEFGEISYFFTERGHFDTKEINIGYQYFFNNIFFCGCFWVVSCMAKTKNQ